MAAHPFPPPVEVRVPTPAGCPAPFFDAELRPHRSLGPLGFWLLMTAVSLVCFTAGIAFLLIGAWPVFGFFGLDVLLIYVAFRLSYRSGRLVEFVRLDERILTLVRRQPGGRTETWRFEPFWVRVAMDDPPRHDSRLVLSSHGRHVTFGGFLTPEERLEVATALRAALVRWRAPRPA
jgi:uncharacterized membrane protein